MCRRMYTDVFYLSGGAPRAPFCTLLFSSGRSISENVVGHFVNSCIAFRGLMLFHCMEMPHVCKQLECLGADPVTCYICRPFHLNVLRTLVFVYT